MRIGPRFLAVIGLASAVVGVATTSGPALTVENSFLERFEGNWSGAGTVMKDAFPVRVNCNAVGQPGTNRVVVQGNCGIAIVSRRLMADLTFDPASGRYRGIYVGSKVGPARLSGRRRGNVIDLTITWPKPVNGDTKATMTVHNDGSGQMRISVADNLEPGGPIETTSDIVLGR